jgi:hypothetical protein
MPILLLIFSFFLMLIGLAGILLPFLPGVIFVWLGLFIYAASTAFDSISLTVVLILLALVLVVSLFDFLAPIIGAKKYKSSRYGIMGAFLGSVLGTALLGFWGIILGPFLGAFLGETLSQKEKPLNSAFGAMVGIAVSFLVRIVLALVIIGFFIASFF